ncbi:MAG: helix-turn-helix transcriptional regulator [Candidatus Acidiferrum sp.]
MANVRQARKQFGLSLNELAAVLGPGFSPARLSLAERGLIQPSPAEQQVILAAIERLGGLRAEARSIIEQASNIDFSGQCEDIRQQAQSLHAVS